MASEEILLKYKADITDLQAKVGLIEASLKKTGKTFVDTGNIVDKGFSKIGEGFKNLAAGFAAGFAIERVIAFGKASFDAFAQAELQAKKLQVAVGVNGGLQEDFQNLIDQSSELQDASIFSDDDIQKAQTMALQFGLTAKQVEDLIPVVADFASATGQSLNGALEAVLRGTEGVGRGLKLYGVEIDKTLTKQEQLGNITEQLTAKFEGQAEVVGETAAGSMEKLNNKLDDFKEKVGGFIVDVGNATSALILWIANGFQPLDEAAENSANSIKLTAKEAEAMRKSLDAISLINLKTQLEALKQAGDAPTAALQSLEDQINSINFRTFQGEINNLDLEGLKKRLAEVGVEAEKTFKIVNRGDLSTEQQKKALEELIAQREREGELIADQNKKETKSNDDKLKQLEEQAKAQEALRKFTLQSLDDNVKLEEAQQKEVAVNRITDQKELAVEIERIELETLEKLKQNRIETLEDTSEIEKQIVEKRIQIRLNEVKADKEAAKQLLADIEQNAKDQIEVLEKVKDDPTTKVNEEQQAQEKILQIRKDAANATEFILNRLLEAGILNEEEYTKIFRELAQERKLIKADEDAARLDSDKKTTKELIDNIIQISEQSLQVASAINDVFAGITQSKIDSLDVQQEAQNEQFDREQEAIEQQVEKRLITEAQGEQQSAELKKQREASEKKSNDAVTALKRKQAEINKTLAIFDATLNLAKAISVALAAAPPPFNAALAAISAALAGAQLAAIIATPLPKFFKGKDYVERGLNPIGRDTIPAMLHEGERIVPTEQNLKHWDVYQAIDENRLDKYIHKTFVVPRLKEQQRIYEKSKESSFAESVGRSVDFTPFVEKMYHDNDYLRRKGVTLNNVKQIAKETAKEVSTEIVRTLMREGKI